MNNVSKHHENPDQFRTQPQKFVAPKETSPIDKGKQGAGRVKSLVGIWEKRIQDASGQSNIQEQKSKEEFSGSRAPLKASAQNSANKTADISKVIKPQQQDVVDIIENRTLELEKTAQKHDLSEVYTQELLSEFDNFETRLLEGQKTVAVKENSQFQNLANLLESLKKDPTKRLILKKSGEIELKEQSRFRIINFFQSLRSKNAQAALDKILSQINGSLNAGHTHFTMFKDGKEENINLKDLLDDFLKTSYAQNVVKQSPTLASTISSTYLSMILKVDPDRFNQLNAKFIQLSNQKSYDGESMQRFINGLQTDRSLILKELESAPSPNLDESFRVKDKVTPIMQEVIETEKTFLDSLKALMSPKFKEGTENKTFFEILHQRGVITESEYKEMTATWNTIIDESSGLLNQLKASEDPVDRSRAYIRAFSPQNPHAQAYLGSLSKSVSHYEALIGKLIEFSKSDSGKTVMEFFGDENKSNTGSPLDPQHFLIMSVQRGPRHNLFMADLNKNIESQTVNDAIQANMTYNVNKLK